MSTADIRFKRVNDEHMSLPNAQDELFDKVDTFEMALLGLTQAVAENRALIMENREMLRAIIKHLDVPYKPPPGFVKE